MRFALCDDDEITLRYLSLLIGDFLKSNRIQIEVDCYSSPEPLLHLIEEKRANPYHAIFLDIELGKSLGTEIARKIRSYDRKFYLIFVTGHADYMPASFALHTYDYIQKPVNPERVRHLLGRLIADLGSTPSITILSDHKTITLNLCDIYYVTGRRNGSTFVAKQGEFPTRLSLKELSSILVPPICRCHNGFYVNIRHATDFSRRVLTLHCGRNIPVGRAYFKEFSREFVLFR